MKIEKEVWQELEANDIAIKEAFDEQDLEKWTTLNGWSNALRWVLDLEEGSA